MFLGSVKNNNEIFFWKWKIIMIIEIIMRFLVGSGGFEL